MIKAEKEQSIRANIEGSIQGSITVFGPDGEPIKELKLDTSAGILVVLNDEKKGNGLVIGRGQDIAQSLATVLYMVAACTEDTDLLTAAFMAAGEDSEYVALAIGQAAMAFALSNVEDLLREASGQLTPEEREAAISFSVDKLGLGPETATKMKAHLRDKTRPIPEA